MIRMMLTVLTLLTLTAQGQPATANTGELSDLPLLTVTVQAQSLEIAAAVPAGRYLVSLTNQIAKGVSLSFVAPPAGHSLAETAEALNDPDAAADWLYETTFLAGPYAAAGESGQGIIDLTPGDWLVWGGDHVPDSAPVLTVTDDGEARAPAREPAVDVEVSLQEYAFVGLDSDVPSGPQTWQLTNTGVQPHEFDLVRAPHEVTTDQIKTLLALPHGATPPPGIPAKDEFVQVAGSGVLSPGQSTWLVLPNFSPGTYVAFCFVPDQNTTAPHAAMGMVKIFTIGAEQA